MNSHTSISGLHLHNRAQNIRKNQIPAMFTDPPRSRMRPDRWRDGLNRRNQQSRICMQRNIFVRPDRHRSLCALFNFECIGAYRCSSLRSTSPLRLCARLER